MRVAALVLVALATAAPPAPSRRVEDHAAFLTPTTRDALDAKLTAYEKATGHQIVVWIERTLAGAPLDEWAASTFAAWKLGRKGIDDGLAMFLFADDRAIAIEVGYGLEERVPDAIASRVIREVMTPKLQAGERDAAVTAGVDAVLAAIEGQPWTAPAVSPSSDVPWPLYVILGIVALLLFIKYPRIGMLVFWSMLRGGGGGGGFRGGGGRSGGGGARGHW